MKFVLFHGAFGGPDKNWFPELKEKLEGLGQTVIVPQFPVDEWNSITNNNTAVYNQNLSNWLSTFDRIYANIRKDENLCFIGHSLGCLFILHVVSKYNLQLDSAIFVSPFLTKLGKEWQFDIVNRTFYKTDFDFRKLRQLIPVSYTLYSDNDPYVEKYLSIGFSKRLRSSPLLVKGAGHMNAEVNLNELPLVLELCKTRLDLSLYQKYMAHRKELYALDYIAPRSEEVIYLEPEEVFDEGVFHFRNLKKRGFATFFTALSFWDTMAVYYKEARKAARRIKDFSRVFVIDKISDLGKRRLLEQINLDLGAGIRVYFIMARDIAKITSDPDFGIWDDEYLCIVRFDKDKQVIVELSSRKADIEKAKGWEKEILQVATRINNTEDDISEFTKNVVHNFG